MRKGLLPALAVTALLVLYGWQIVGRGFALIRTGEPVGIAVGVGALLIPLVVIWLIIREFLLASTVQTMADRLAATGELPVDDLPRSPGGRIDREAADAAFVTYREAVQAAPEDWRAWYRLAFAYDASHDRKRARESLRKAAALYRGHAKAPEAGKSA